MSGQNYDEARRLADGTAAELTEGNCRMGDPRRLELAAVRAQLAVADELATLTNVLSSGIAALVSATDCESHARYLPTELAEAVNRRG